MIIAVILWHLEMNLRIHMLCHLLLHHALLLWVHKTATIIDACHALEFIVLTGVAAYCAELRIENVLSVAAPLNPVIDN